MSKSSDGGGGGSRENKNSIQKPPDDKKKRTRKSRSTERERDLEQDPDYAQLLKCIQEEGVQIGDKLGSGSYSVVIKAIINNEKEKGLPVAIKIIHTKIRNDYVVRFLPREMKIVQEIEHRNILAFHAVKDFRESDKPLPFVVFTTEFAGGGDLLCKIKKLQSQGHKGMTEKDMKITFRQLIDALDYLDKKHIVHRDLKCENIMLDVYENVKLGDFGFARHLGPNEKSNTFCGSRAYVAPEIVLSKSYYGRPADVWSVGIIMYVSTTGHFPFDDRNQEKMIKDQLAHKIKFSSKWQGSRELKTIIIETLHPMPKSRPSYEALLRHEFLRGTPSQMRGPGSAEEKT